MRRGALLVLALWPLGPWLFTGAAFRRGTRRSGRSGRSGPAAAVRRVQRNPYEVLGLQGGSSYDDIRAAFRKLARTYHPDVPGTGDEDRFRSIREALEELGTAAGRARWSGASGARSSSSRTSARAYSYGAGVGYGSASYASDFGGYGYSYERAEYYEPYEPREREREPRQRDRKRRTERDQREREREREWRQQGKREEAKKARGGQDAIMEKELKKAVKEAQFRQAERKKEWRRSMKDAQSRLKKRVQEEMQGAWNVVHQFQDDQKDYGRKQAERWREKLEATRNATVEQRKEDGEMWVQKFAEVKQQAADGREEMGRRFAEKWRDFRQQTQRTAQRTEVLSPEKINEEIEELLKQQDERISQSWQDMYKGMMKSVQRSINDEPKHWKDRFRIAMSQLGRGGEGVKRWRGLFQDSMKDMGEQEMKEVAEWVGHFKSQRPWTNKELAQRSKLMQVSRNLKAMDSTSQQSILKSIKQCRQAEIQRLKYQAWDRSKYMNKFRQEQDRLWKSQQAEELKMTEEFWQAVKESVLREDVQRDGKTR